MNKKNTLVLVGSLLCVALLGYFTYSTVSTLIKSKAASQEVSKNTPTDDEDNDLDTSSENKDKNQSSQSDLSERLKETDSKKEEKNSDTNENTSEKTSNKSESNSDINKGNSTTNKETNKNTSDKNNNSKETTDKETKPEVSKSENKKTLNYSSYLNDLETEKYTLKENESLSDVAKKFKETCTVNSSLNIIKSLNQISNTSTIESGDTLLVPVNAFTDGKKYSVKEGDTWYSIARKNYPNYNHEIIIDFLMDINPFHKDILPLGEDVFLPNI